MDLMKFRSIFGKEAYVSAFLISESNLFHSFIVYCKKEFLKDKFSKITHKYNLYYAMIFGKEELDHRGRQVVLYLQFCTGNITASAIFYLNDSKPNSWYNFI